MSDLHPPDESHINSVDPPTDNVGTKRQRRPSVRLGDIGPYETTLNHHPNRKTTKHYKLPITTTTKSSKTKLIDATTFDDSDIIEQPPPNFDLISTWTIRDYSKSKRNLTKRVRSTKIKDYSKTDDENVKFSEDGDDDDGDDEFRDFEPEGSDTPIKDDQSPIDDSNRLNFDTRGGVSTRAVEMDGIEIEGGPPSDTYWNNTTTNNNNNSERNGVRVWLNQLGLGRYAPFFEIHEVDDEVLPMLTLEDLKDMGINAVGSRRKMYSSIQKLGKGFS